MHRPTPTLAAVLAALIHVVIASAPVVAAVPESIAEARALLNRGEAINAVAILEGTLGVTTPEHRAAVIELLRSAYESAAKEAEAKGRPGDAELYRDNLEILKHSQPSVRSGEPRPQPQVQPPISPLDPHVPVPSPDVPASPIPVVESTRPDEPSPGNTPLPQPEAPASPPVLALPPPVPTPATSRPPAATHDLATADAAFLARRYDEAGRLYSALDREGRLPVGRRDHWAYCRWTEVVRRINARPTSQEEWAELDSEIQRIRALSPNNWYGEYLRNRASERPAGGKAKASNRVVIRGSSPDELASKPATPRAQAAPPP